MYLGNITEKAIISFQLYGILFQLQIMFVVSNHEYADMQNKRLGLLMKLSTVAFKLITNGIKVSIIHQYVFKIN